jgi:hypothetical protein
MFRLPVEQYSIVTATKNILIVVDSRDERPCLQDLDYSRTVYNCVVNNNTQSLVADNFCDIVSKSDAVAMRDATLEYLKTGEYSVTTAIFGDGVQKVYKLELRNTTLKGIVSPSDYGEKFVEFKIISVNGDKKLVQSHFLNDGFSVGEEICVQKAWVEEL